MHQCLGGVAADRREHQLGRLVPLREPEAPGHELGRVDDPPPEWHDDPDAVGPTEERVPRAGSAARHGAVAVLRRRPQRGGHEVEGLRPLRGVQSGIGRGHDLADAHDDGGARVEGHGPRSVPADTRDLPGAPVEWSAMRAVPGHDVEGTP